METIFEYTDFIDFMGKKHDCVVAGTVVSYKEGDAFIGVNDGSHLMFDEYGDIVYDDEDSPVVVDDITELAPVFKVISIGISICNPEDKFEVWKGEKQAEGRALKRMDRLIAFSKGGMCVEDTVRYFVQQTADNLSKFPGLFIKGYNEKMKKFLNA